MKRRHFLTVSAVGASIAALPSLAATALPLVELFKSATPASSMAMSWRVTGLPTTCS